MVFPTSDGQMVYGLSVVRNERRFLADLMTFLNSAKGYIDFEKPPPADPPRPAKPEPVGAGVPEPPAEPAQPLNRRQRRALKRLRGKEQKRGHSWTAPLF